jgi:hypothetical protein
MYLLSLFLIFSLNLIIVQSNFTNLTIEYIESLCNITDQNQATNEIIKFYIDNENEYNLIKNNISQIYFIYKVKCEVICIKENIIYLYDTSCKSYQVIECLDTFNDTFNIINTTDNKILIRNKRKSGRRFQKSISSFIKNSASINTNRISYGRYYSSKKPLYSSYDSLPNSSLPNIPLLNTIINLYPKFYPMYINNTYFGYSYCKTCEFNKSYELEKSCYSYSDKCIIIIAIIIFGLIIIMLIVKMRNKT